jgi:hypothetical protein
LSSFNFLQLLKSYSSFFRGITLLSSFGRKHLSSSPLVETKLNPYWVTGFVDAEGCFSVIISKRSNLQWRVIVSFEINLHPKDINILYRIKEFFGVGNVTSRKKLAVYRVTAINDLLTVIIPHFTSYPLISQKNSDFQLWATVVNMMNMKQHLDQSGFLSILSYYASINRGMSSTVKLAFPDVIPVERPIVTLPENLNPNWVSGFCAGDGGFSLGIRSNNRVYFRFHIAQHSRDLALLELFIKFFNCGVVYNRPSTARCDFIVQSRDHLCNVIIPHFLDYPLENIKTLDFLDFKRGMDLINSGDINSKMNELRNIISNLNTRRIHDS